MGRPLTEDAKKDSLVKKYCLSCIAATAAETVTYPLDITKTRLQIQGEHATKQNAVKSQAYRGMLKTGIGIVKEEGLVQLWQGVTPAILRHFVYSGSRMTFYEVLRESVLKKDDDGYFPVWKAIVGGAVAGAAGQYLASPTDLIKVQMQMEGKRVLQGQPKKYNGTIHAFQSIIKTAGIRGLWKGWLPNCQRAALVNMGDLTTYDSAKHLIIRRTHLEDNTITHALSSICSGLIAATVGTPADVIKTRIMNDPNMYKGSMDCFLKAVKHEGFFSLYKGFVPTWTRMAITNVTFHRKKVLHKTLTSKIRLHGR